MRNKSKLIGGVMLALFVVFALAMPATAPTWTWERMSPAPSENKTYTTVDYHYLDENDEAIGGYAAITPESEVYGSMIPDNANILEGYFERWHSITKKSCSEEFIILFQEQIPIGPNSVRTEQEELYEKKIKCDGLNKIYPFSIDVSKYRGKKIYQIIILNEDDICQTDTKQLAYDLIEATQSRISELKREGVETTEIEELVKRGKEKYDAGEYVEAAKVATDAKSRADLAYHNKKTFVVDFALFPPVLPPTPTPSPAPLITPSPSPAPAPTPTSTVTPTPSPTHLPPIPPSNDSGKGVQELFLQLLPFFAAIVLVVVLFKPLMLKYYRAKINKYEKKGYDVSTLKEVLKK